MTQLSLAFTPTRLARKHDPATSQDAASKSESFRARHIALILDALKTHGPMTAKEIAGFIRLDSVQITRRAKEMSEAGLVTIGPDVVDGCRVWRVG